MVPLWFALLCQLRSGKRGYQPPSDETLRRMFPELNPTSDTAA